MGGWSQVKSMRFLGMRVSSDDLILGSGKFVNNLLKDVDKKVKHQFLGQDRLKQVEQFISEVCNKENINIKELKSGSRRGTISKIISNLAIRLVKKGVWDFICRESASVGSINIGCFKNYQKNGK